jgi:hypothetical protein
MYHGLVVLESTDTGFKLVVGKFIFRYKKIGDSRKVNLWIRNFRLPTNRHDTSWFHTEISKSSLPSNHQCFSLFEILWNPENSVGNLMSSLSWWFFYKQHNRCSCSTSDHTNTLNMSHPNRIRNGRTKWCLTVTCRRMDCLLGDVCQRSSPVIIHCETWWTSLK